MQVTNETVLSRKYDEEYARFNYIMVGAAIGLLLIICIVAKILCICNKDTELEQMRLLAERRAAINRLENAPKEPDYQIRSKVLKKIEATSSMTTATNSMNSTRMPGQILSPELVHRQSSVGVKRPNVQQIGWRWSSGQSAVGSFWAGSRSVLHLQSIIPSSASFAAVLEEEADEHVEDHVTHPRSDHHPPPHNHAHRHQHHHQTMIHCTVRPPIVKIVSRVESPIKENVTDFLQKIQTVI